MCKWNWCFAIERGVFWRQIINSKHGEVEGSWCSKEVGESYGVGLWKAIRNLWKIVNCRISFLVGNERRLKFWKDKWCGDEPLSVSFPSLFALATSKEAWVVDLWSHSNGSGIWIPRFSRHLND